MRRRAGPLETVSVEVPADAMEAFEAAIDSVCATIAFFLIDEDRGIWRIEGVRDVPEDDRALEAALAIAEAITGVAPAVTRAPTAADGWLARTLEAFPDQLVGTRFLIRGSHSQTEAPGRIALTLDAGLAFGSGEHGSTRGCLRALEIAARRRPSRILDMGTGSGILAMAAARLVRRPVLATDIEAWSVRVTAENSAVNGVGGLVRPLLADGWRDRRVHGPYDLVFANILAGPLCRMAGDLSRNLAPGGSAILAGLLNEQKTMVLVAHRRHGLALERTIREGRWTTLLLRKAG